MCLTDVHPLHAIVDTFNKNDLYNNYFEFGIHAYIPDKFVVGNFVNGCRKKKIWRVVFLIAYNSILNT